MLKGAKQLAHLGVEVLCYTVRRRTCCKLLTNEIGVAACGR